MDAIEIQREDLVEDGGGWFLVFKMYGVVYRAGYVANKFSFGMVPYKFKPIIAKWKIKNAEKFARERFAMIPKEWFAIHETLYAEA